jgi:hypothetical protein
LLNVDGAAVLRRSAFPSKNPDCMERAEASGETYLVRLVVVLRVVLEDLGPLLVVKGADELFDAHIRIRCPPLFRVDEPAVVSARSLRPKVAPCVVTHIFFASSTSNFRARRNRSCTRIRKARTNTRRPPYHGKGVHVLGIARLLQSTPQLEYLGILLRRCVPWVSVLRFRSGCGVVEVDVVLGIELELVCCGCHVG